MSNVVHWTQSLINLHACREAVAWATGATGYPSLEAAWEACERADWLLWLAGKFAGPPGSESRKPLVRAACACARTALVHVRAGEHRPLRAIETAEAWTRGEASLDEVRQADAADAAADAASYASYAASYASYAAYDASYAAYAASDAAYAASSTDT